MLFSEDTFKTRYIHTEIRLNKSSLWDECGCQGESQKNILTFVFFPVCPLTRSTRHSDLLTHNLYFRGTFSGMPPLFSESQCLTTQILTPFPLPNSVQITLCGPQHPVTVCLSFISCCCHKTLQTGTLIYLLLILGYKPLLWRNQDSRKLKNIHSREQSENESMHASQCSASSPSHSVQGLDH